MLTGGVHLKTLVRRDMTAPSNKVRDAHHRGLQASDRACGCDGGSRVLQDRRKRRSRRVRRAGAANPERLFLDGRAARTCLPCAGIHAVSGDLGTF